MRRFFAGALIPAVALVLCGCGANYAWRASVPQEMRSVTVPTFRNESAVEELGAIASRQLLRELQREGTFRIASAGDAALEIQGVVKSVSSGVNAYSRRANMRIAAYDLTATVEVSVIDRRAHRVLIDNRIYTARTGFTAGQDRTTAMRDASGRLMDDLSRQVVDDLLNAKW